MISTPAEPRPARRQGTGEPPVTRRTQRRLSRFLKLAWLGRKEAGLGDVDALDLALTRGPGCSHVPSSVCPWPSIAHTAHGPEQCASRQTWTRRCGSSLPWQKPSTAKHRVPADPAFTPRHSQLPRCTRCGGSTEEALRARRRETARHDARGRLRHVRPVVSSLWGDSPT